MKKEAEFPTRRRSVSAEASFRAEQARISAMTIEERVIAALSLPDRFSWIGESRPATETMPDGGSRAQSGGR